MQNAEFLSPEEVMALARECTESIKHLEIQTMLAKVSSEPGSTEELRQCTKLAIYGDAVRAMEDVETELKKFLNLS